MTSSSHLSCLKPSIELKNHEKWCATIANCTCAFACNFWIIQFEHKDKNNSIFQFMRIFAALSSQHSQCIFTFNQLKCAALEILIHVNAHTRDVVDGGIYKTLRFKCSKCDFLNELARPNWCNWRKNREVLFISRNEPKKSLQMRF